MKNSKLRTSNSKNFLRTKFKRTQWPEWRNLSLSLSRANIHPFGSATHSIHIYLYTHTHSPLELLTAHTGIPIYTRLAFLTVPDGPSRACERGNKRKTLRLRACMYDNASDALNLYRYLYACFRMSWFVYTCISIIQNKEVYFWVVGIYAYYAAFRSRSKRHYENIYTPTSGFSAVWRIWRGIRLTLALARTFSDFRNVLHNNLDCSSSSSSSISDFLYLAIFINTPI